MDESLYRDLEREGRVLYVNRGDVEALAITMDEAIALVEAALREKGRGEVEMPPKPGIHPREDAFIHAMPASIPRMGAAGIKWVSGYPENDRYDLPYITGLLILNSPATGVPIAVMDCTWITEVRTAAATAVAARHLARADSRAVGIVGCGVQGRSNLRALSAILRLESVRAYDLDDEVLSNYVREMREELDLEVRPATSPREAVAEADIIVTATPILKHPQPVIELSWLKEGCLGVPLDFDAYWKPEAMSGVDRFYVDDRVQFEYYREVGYFRQAPAVDGDLGEVVAGVQSGRASGGERMISMNLGVAVEDVAVAAEVFRRARQEGVGTELER